MLTFVLAEFYRISQYLKTLTNNPRAQHIANAIGFFYLWPLYGLIHISPANLQDNFYSLLDTLTKAGYSVYLP